ncbi:MAG: DUF1499 domain-containing protein [Acidimicrobiales bacterium]|nr:DUF1499 domain-containing protein [Hyphomonadaceae bacterium]RZV42595.1 MAG: DUF1499 domain-containing protein [Acidimicrobiales bacterium]
MKIALYVLLGLVVFVLVSFYILGKKSQNGSAPGLADNKLAECSSKPNCVSSEARTPDAKKVAPFKASQWDALKGAVKANGGVITNEQENYFSAEFSSSIFKFVDDFEARRNDEFVHVRSASRVGYSDRGVNKKRIEVLRNAIS